MKVVAQWTIIAALAGVHLTALWALLHPRPNPAYRDYYINHTRTDGVTTHYPSTPEQGMIFGREGLPEWVESTYGLSWREEWGRWTDVGTSRTPSIEFSRPFAGNVCVDFTARAARWLVGKPFTIRMADQTRGLQFAGADLSDYRADFSLAQGAAKLEFVFPENVPRVEEVDHTSHDPRRIALLLDSLRILPGNCATNPAIAEHRQ